MCVMCAVVVNTGACWFSQAGPVLATITEVVDAPGIVPGPTPFSIAVGDVFLGNITTNDVDLISINLTAGEFYQFLLTGRDGTPGLDTFIEIYSADGTFLGMDDDGGGELSSLLSFVPTVSGTYLLAVSTFNGIPGDYQLRAINAPPLPVASLDTLANYLTDGYWQFTGGQRHAFNTVGNNEITVNLTGLTADGRALALAALDAWEMVANLNFRVVTTGGAQITFDDADAGAYASYSAIGTQTISSFVNVSVEWLARYGTGLDSYSFSTYVHEIGHALGLGHQGPYNARASFAVDAIFANDSYAVSIMSYFDQFQNPHDPGSFGEPLTAMMADIVAIQNLYGAPVGGVTAGNTVWGEGSTLTNFLGDFFRAEFGAPDSMSQLTLTIFDESGRDRVVFSTDTTNQTVRLEGEARWNVFSGIGNVMVARGTVLEDYTAGSGNDSVTGNAVANLLIGNAGLDLLEGMAGNDTLEGGTGDDRLDGGADIDRLIGGAGNDTYIVDHVSDVVVEAAGGGIDVVQASATHRLAENVENLVLTGAGAVNGSGNGLANLMTGNGAANSLAGGVGNDTLNGGGGNDTLNGGTGVDSLIGGSGNDTYLLGDADDVIIELAGGGRDFVQTSLTHRLVAQVEDLTLIGTAAVNGSGNDLANRLVGNEAANSLAGGVGNDTLVGAGGNDTLNGGSGADSLIGGAGNDTYLLGDADDVIIELAGGGRDFVQTSLTHTLAAQVEDLTLIGTAAVNGTGNDLANRLVGNGAANTLVGGAGHDTLVGAGGNDTLNGGTGADSLIGGAGNDVLTGGGDADQFLFDLGRDRITDFQDNIDTLRIEADLLGAGAATWAGLEAVGRAFADRVEFHFAPDHVLTVFGVTQVAQLQDDYVFV